MTEEDLHQFLAAEKDAIAKAVRDRALAAMDTPKGGGDE